jgi:hypothetical protein
MPVCILLHLFNLQPQSGIFAKQLFAKDCLLLQLIVAARSLRQKLTQLFDLGLQAIARFSAALLFATLQNIIQFHFKLLHPGFQCIGPLDSCLLEALRLQKHDENEDEQPEIRLSFAINLYSGSMCGARARVLQQRGEGRRLSVTWALSILDSLSCIKKFKHEERGRR